MPDGVRENELCPVFTARTASEPSPDPAEIAEAQWVPWPAFRDRVISGEAEVSTWCALQVPDLARREGADGHFATASYDDLPPAARPTQRRR
jgi:isopentenyl-diphosphate delta-isomerase